MIDDLPITLKNSFDSAKEAVRIPLDADAEKFLLDWIAARPAFASASIFGPTWSSGFRVLIVGDLRIQVEAGVAWPVQTIESRKYSRRVQMATTVLDVPVGASMLSVVFDPDQNAPALRMIPLVRLQVPRTDLSSTQLEQEFFFYAPPVTSLATAVPIALVIGDPTNPEPGARGVTIRDMRMPPLGFKTVRRYLGLPWFMPEVAFRDTDPTVNQNQKPSPWIEAAGLQIYFLIPSDCEVEISFECDVGNMATSHFSPLVDGVLVDENLVWSAGMVEIEPKFAPGPNNLTRHVSLRTQVPVSGAGVHRLAMGMKGTASDTTKFPDFAARGLLLPMLQTAELRVRLMQSI